MNEFSKWSLFISFFSVFLVEYITTMNTIENCIENVADAHDLVEIPMYVLILQNLENF